MLIIVIGRRGSGKTLWTTIQSLKSKREVWSNYQINIDRYKELKVVDLIDDLPRNTEVIIDEAYTWLESRTAGRGLNKYLTYLAFQIRKANQNFILTAQQLGSIDVRYRNEWDYLVYCERYPVRDVRRKEWDFLYSMLDSLTLQIVRKRLSFNNAKKYFKYYDTDEIIPPYDKKHLEFDLLKSDPERLYSKVCSIADTIEKDIDKITHSTVSNALIKNGYPEVYQKFVYDLLTGKLKKNRGV